MISNTEIRRMRKVVVKGLLAIDSQVLAILLHRSWTVVAGGVTVFMIPLFLDPLRQGCYFAFGNILGLQVFFELGMSQVVVQFVAHEPALEILRAVFLGPRLWLQSKIQSSRTPLRYEGCSICHQPLFHRDHLVY